LFPWFQECPVKACNTKITHHNTRFGTWCAHFSFGFCKFKIESVYFEYVGGFYVLHVHHITAVLPGIFTG
jgi:hypothetical protein